MAKGRKTGGRRKGSTNKTTASVKQALVEAFGQLGGVPSLVAFGEAQPAEFYKLWAKILPREVEVSGKDGDPIRVTQTIVIGGKEIAF